MLAWVAGETRPLPEGNIVFLCVGPPVLVGTALAKVVSEHEMRIKDV